MIPSAVLLIATLCVRLRNETSHTVGKGKLREQLADLIGIEVPRLIQREFHLARAAPFLRQFSIRTNLLLEPLLPVGADIFVEITRTHKLSADGKIHRRRDRLRMIDDQVPASLFCPVHFKVFSSQGAGHRSPEFIPHVITEFTPKKKAAVLVVIDRPLHVPVVAGSPVIPESPQVAPLQRALSVPGNQDARMPTLLNGKVSKRQRKYWYFPYVKYEGFCNQFLIHVDFHLIGPEVKVRILFFIARGKFGIAHVNGFGFHHLQNTARVKSILILRPPPENTPLTRTKVIHHHLAGHHIPGLGEFRRADVTYRLYGILSRILALYPGRIPPALGGHQVFFPIHLNLRRSQGHIQILHPGLTRKDHHFFLHLNVDILSFVLNRALDLRSSGFLFLSAVRRYSNIFLPDKRTN